MQLLQDSKVLSPKCNIYIILFSFKAQGSSQKREFKEYKEPDVMDDYTELFSGDSSRAVVHM